MTHLQNKITIFDYIDDNTQRPASVVDTMLEEKCPASWEQNFDQKQSESRDHVCVAKESLLSITTRQNMRLHCIHTDKSLKTSTPFHQGDRTDGSVTMFCLPAVLETCQTLRFPWVNFFLVLLVPSGLTKFCFWSLSNTGKKYFPCEASSLVEHRCASSERRLQKHGDHV